MNKYRITFDFNGCARTKNIQAESEGEALEIFEEVTGFADYEVIGIVEV